MSSKKEPFHVIILKKIRECVKKFESDSLEEKRAREFAEILASAIIPEKIKDEVMAELKKIAAEISPESRSQHMRDLFLSLAEEIRTGS